MDIISHAIWGVTFVRKKDLFWLAMFFGALPDLISTGIGSLYSFLKTGSFLKENWWLNLPIWSKHLYFLFHSIFGLLILFFILFLFKRKFLILIIPYFLHIFIDLFTHRGDPIFRLFYPFIGYSTERVFGINWWESSFVILLNIILIVGINIFIFLKNKIYGKIKES
jgi:membrane-bound metal-dependent hydrolase YbcI (DUF457 family)